MIRRIAALVLLLWSGRAAAQTPVIRLEDAGPGVGPELLARALSAPHDVVAPAAERFLVSRASAHPRTIIVLGRDAVVEGRVQGDVIVVAGDLYMHPGGEITGSAVSIGGGVYESMLATVGGSVKAFRGFTYDITPTPDAFALRYRALESVPQPGLSFGGLFGLTLPTYDRSNGLSVGIAPRHTFAGTPLVLTPRVTYRSQLGRIDPSVSAEYAVDRRTLVTAAAGIETRTNERWIRSDLVNSAVFFATGIDARNYYRAAFADARASRSFESVTGVFTPYLGVSVERGRSVRPDTGANGGPWTVVERKDGERERRLRVNPRVNHGTIASVRGGGAWTWSSGATVADARLDGEVSPLTPSNMGAGTASSAFGQLTFDGGISFPTFGAQSLAFAGHAVGTTGSAPRQRWSYVGGSGTVSTMELLEEGGDQVVFLEATYLIPLDAVQLPFAGSPVIGLRQVLAGAASGGFPALHQASGVRVYLSRAYGEFMLDPSTRRGRAGVGIDFGR